MSQYSFKLSLNKSTNKHTTKTRKYKSKNGKRKSPLLVVINLFSPEIMDFWITNHRWFIALNIVLNKRFWIEKLIDAGTHGQVFNGVDTLVKPTRSVAVKIIPEAKMSTRKFNREIQVIRRLNAASHVGFPELIFKGKCKIYNYYVMEKLGSSLKYLRSLTQKFTIQNVLMCALQMVERLRTIHKFNFIHRDMKPANLLFGVKDSFEGTLTKQFTKFEPTLSYIDDNINTLYLIDYGLTKREDRFDEDEIPPEIFEKDMVSLSGTPNYASINLHSAWDLCFKKDDLEGMLYVIIHMCKGKLPWEDCRTDDNYYE